MFRYKYDANVSEILLLNFTTNWDKNELNELFWKYGCGIWGDIHGRYGDEGAWESVSF